METLSRWWRTLPFPGHAFHSYESLPTTSTEGRGVDGLLSDEQDHEKLPKFVNHAKSSRLFLYVRCLFNLLSTTSFGQIATSVLSKLRNLLTSFLLILIPSFINIQQNHNTALPPTTRPNKPSPTAYLNGLRGLAAYIVFCQHFINYFYGVRPLYGYHSKPKQMNSHLIQLSFIRLIHSGRFCVTLFYLLSGYVLGYKPLQLIRGGDLPALMRNLSSAVFRRWLRLFLPLLPPLVLAGVCVYAGWYGAGDPMKGNLEHRKDGTFWGEMVQVWKTWEKVSNPFNQKTYYPRTIPALYTLRVEFRGSIFVFTVLLGTARVKSWVRILIISSIATYGLRCGRWDIFLFLTGVVMAEFRCIRGVSSWSIKDVVAKPHIARCLGYANAIFWIAAVILSLFLGSFPRRGAGSTPGYRTLTAITPRGYRSSDDGRSSFWCSVASVLLVLALENFPVLQKPFNTAFARYMGDISFSLYILHVPIYMTVGRWVTVALIKCLGHFTLGVCAGGLVVTGTMIVVADLQWRVVDMKSVKLARWLEEKMAS